MLVRRLQEHFLAATDTDGVRPVLVVDDSHDIRPDVLGLLRVLTNFDMLRAAARNMSCAESSVVQSAGNGLPARRTAALRTGRHNHRLCSIAISWSGGEKAPGRRVGGTTASSVSSFTEGSACRYTSVVVVLEWPSQSATLRMS